MHAVGNERMTRLELAQRAAQVLGLDCSLIEGVTTEMLGQRAARPLSAGLVTSRAVAELGIEMRGVEAAVADMSWSTG